MRSRHSTDTMPEFHAEAPQATVSEGLAQGPYVAASEGVESMTLRTKGVDSTNAQPRPQYATLLRRMKYTLFKYLHACNSVKAGALVVPGPSPLASSSMRRASSTALADKRRCDSRKTTAMEARESGKGRQCAFLHWFCIYFTKSYSF